MIRFICEFFQIVSNLQKIFNIFIEKTRTQVDPAQFKPMLSESQLRFKSLHTHSGYLVKESWCDTILSGKRDLKAEIVIENKEGHYIIEMF